MAAGQLTVTVANSISSDVTALVACTSWRPGGAVAHKGMADGGRPDAQVIPGRSGRAEPARRPWPAIASPHGVEQPLSPGGREPG